jgi:hypothetical protein
MKSPGFRLNIKQGEDVMKKLLIMVAILGLFSLPLSAQTNSLYDQEGTAADGYTPIDASGQGPSSDPDNSWLNWKYQYGGGSWAGIYGDAGWIEIASTGDSALDVECDIEMYYSEEYFDNKIYFHIGDPFNAVPADLQATFTGNLVYNNGMYIGVNFTGTSKDETNMEGYPSALTGRVFDAMDGTIDVLGRDISGESFDILLELDWGAGYVPPVSYGDGASGTVHDTLWWLVDSGNPGSYNVTWRLTLEPDPGQPDGNYYFDPLIVSCPTL